MYFLFIQIRSDTLEAHDLILLITTDHEKKTEFIGH
jgi:hypothetical protein